MSQPPIGIDLGTTNSLLAVFEDEELPLTPSVVQFSGDRILVGQEALEPPDGEEFTIVRSIKRRMGSDYSIEAGGRRWIPQEISARILSKVRQDAERRLGMDLRKAVITVPAYFNDNQRAATREAGLIAGLDVTRILNEPTAAALAYGLHREQVETVLVWDLGGGTFDVSILELDRGFFHVRAVNGDTRLGGDDFDDRIVRRLHEPRDAREAHRIRQAAEAAKIRLSSQDEVEIVPGEPLTRESFEASIADLLERMVGPTRQALSDAGLEPIDLDRVILVGGATRMPAVIRLAREVTGLEPYRRLDPDRVVARGAAVEAAMLEGRVPRATLVDVVPISLGIETAGGVFTRLIDRNTSIPVTRSQIFTTAREDQTAVDVHVLQGEREMAAGNVSLGTLVLDDLTPEARVEVAFNIDANGLLQVTVLDIRTDRKRKIRIESATRLDPEQIERMVLGAERSSC